MADAGALSSRVRRFYVFEALIASGLWAPFWNLWLFNFTDFFQATLVDVAFWGTSLLLAMPAGALADRYGRKPAVLLGVALWSLGIVVWGLSTSLITFTLASIVWAAGAEFLWSTGTAYLYDTLAEGGLEKSYPRIVSRVTLLSFIANAGGSFVGGLVVGATRSFNVTLLLYAIPGAAALGIGASFREPAVHRETASNVLGQIRAGMKTTVHNRQIVLVTIFQIIVSVVTYIMAFFRPAFVEDLVAGDFPLMGAAYAGFFCVAAAAGLSMGSILERLGESGALVLAYLLVFVPFLFVYGVGAGAVPPNLALGLGLAAQASFYVFLGFEGPIVSTIVNRRIASDERATVLSITSFFTTLSLAVFEPMVGFLAIRYDLGVGLATLAGVASIPCAYLVVAYRKSEKASPTGIVPASHDRGL